MSRWVRHVELAPEQRQRLIDKIEVHRVIAAEKKSARARAVRAQYQEHGRELARQGDASYIAGCMLFWAEGSKARNVAQITNADPDLVASFLAFLRTSFEIADDQLAVTCNLFADHVERQREIEEFWLTKLNLPPSALRKSIVNNYSKYSQKKRQNKLPFGTCRLTAFSTRIVQTIYGSIQEYGGFERPEWLD